MLLVALMTFIIYDARDAYAPRNNVTSKWNRAQLYREPGTRNECLFTISLCFFFLWCTHAARVEYQELKAPQHEWECDTLSGWVHKSVRRRFQKLDASQDENMHMLHAIFWQGSITSNIQDVPFCLFLSQDDDHNLLGLVHILKPYTWYHPG